MIKSMIKSMIKLQEKTRILNAMLGKMEAWAHAAHAPFYVDRMSSLFSNLVLLSQAKNKEAEECDWIHSIPATHVFWTF